MDAIKLEQDFNDMFEAMNGVTDGSGDVYLAKRMAKAVADFVLSGKTATADAGAAPAGTYAGAGRGTMSINAGDLEAGLRSAFENSAGNDALAGALAAASHAVCAAGGTVSETSSGTVTTPAGVTAAFSGPADGAFSGDKSVLSAALAACFDAMNGMASGGNEYLARRTARAYNDYVTKGSISVTLKAPFVSGSGKGNIS